MACMPVAGRTRMHAICGAHPSGRYVLGGIAYNMTQRGMQFGLEAMPHIELWRQLPGLVKADYYRQSHPAWREARHDRIV